MAVEKVNEYDHLSFIDDAFKLAKEKAEATYDGKGKLKIKASVSCLLYDIVDNKSKVMLCRLNKEKAETEDPRMFDNMLAFTGGKPEKEDYGKLDRFSCPCGSTVSKKNKSSHLKSKKHLDYQTSTTGLDPKLATMIFRMSQKIDEIADAVSILLGDMDSDDDLEDVEEGEEEDEPKKNYPYV